MSDIVQEGAEKAADAKAADPKAADPRPVDGKVAPLAPRELSVTPPSLEELFLHLYGPVAPAGRPG